MIGIVNYGSGNIYAIANIYHRLNIPHRLMSAPEEFHLADKLILPGVGAFDETMFLLKEKGMVDVLNTLVLDTGIPILGVCVGMQVLANKSDEGQSPGFGWIQGVVREIDASQLASKPYTPHMGWNSIATESSNPLFEGVDQKQGFYFLHSYYFDCHSDDDVLCYTEYGEKFASAVKHKNVYGLQFHPEKSHSNGVKVFENYAKL